MRIAHCIALVAAVAACAIVSHDVSAQEAERFTHLAHDAQHTGIADTFGPSLLGAPRFVATVPNMEFVGPSTPVVADFRVFVYADRIDPELQTYVGTYVLAFSEFDGSLLWSRQVADRRYDSWASPAAYLDEADGESVVVSSGSGVYRLDAATGAIEWTAWLSHTANASPVVADGKVFATDYTGYAGGGKIYAFDVSDGAVLWSHVLGRTSGNTPTYAGGVVYVGTAGGTVYALDAATGAEQWNAPLVSGTGKGFYGGTSVRDGALYIASYNFYGGEDSARLFKLDASTGALLWTAASERTDSIPIVVDGKVVLSGGVYGFGSKRKLECFDEATGAMLWSYTGAGGWCHQPCYADGLLYAGLIVSEGYFFGPAVNLQVLDVSKAPGEPGFMLDEYGACGSSPAVANANVYSIGLLGDETALYAFGPPPQVAPRITSLVHDRPTPAQERFTVTWTTRCGLMYVVQYSDGTARGAYDPAASWTDIPESQVTESDGAPGDEGTESWTDDGTSSAGVSTTGSRFYRVRVVL